MNKILVILGPTASGKSGLAVEIARKFNGEIISADSRQVYKGLDIGTGKITKKEMRGVHHWLLDVINPQKKFDVSQWKKLAEERIGTILKRSKLPIICGGTGFYIQSIVDGVVLPEVPPNKTLRKKLEKKSLEELVSTLKKLDSQRLRNIDAKNKVRLIRAIEIATELGKVPKIIKEKVPYEILQIGIKTEDSQLRKQINKRLDQRIKIGMTKEAESLQKKGLSFKRMRELGLEYRYLAEYLENNLSKKELADKIKAEIWQYSKRQMTWFKRDKKINWFKIEEKNKILKKVENFLA